MTPTEFETVVLGWLDRAAAAEGQAINAQHLGVAEGPGGEYKIDVLVTFSAFLGARFIVLAECKHQGRPVEREDVMILDAKVRDVGAHKGMLFSTSGFQSGALKYAKAHGLATVAVVKGAWLYMTRAEGSLTPEPPPWAHFDAFAGIRMSKTRVGVTCHAIDTNHPAAIVEWLREQSSGRGDRLACGRA
jgi:restriction system protein